MINSGNSFMDIEIKTWLYDILNAINEIESFLLTDQKTLLLTSMIFEQNVLLNVTLKSSEKQ